MRPVVELATVGCFAGAGVGIILLNWVDEEKTTDNYPLFNAVLTVDRRVVSHVVSFGIVFGFWYPWIAVESGKLLGVRSGTHTTSVSVATVMFAIVVSAVFIGCLFFMSVPLRDRRFEESHPLF